MRKNLFTLIVVGCLFWCGGCNLLEKSLEDVYTWDVSACVSGFDTCWELFFDNIDKFEDGFVDAMNTLEGV